MTLVRKITLSDLNAIVLIHIEAFPNFFLTSLGPSFLNCYYRSLIKSSDGIGLCAIEGTDIVGFCAGTVNTNKFHKRLLLNNIYFFSLQFCKLIFLRPKALIRLFFNMEKVPLIDISGDISELMSIGVKPNVKGTGVGVNLLVEFEKAIKVSGSKVITLTTDFYNNENVLRFYSKNGYLVHSDFITYPNRRMYKLIKQF